MLRMCQTSVFSSEKCICYTPTLTSTGGTKGPPGTQHPSLAPAQTLHPVCVQSHCARCKPIMNLGGAGRKNPALQLLNSKSIKIPSNQFSSSTEKEILFSIN